MYQSYSTCFGHFGHVTGYNVDDIENLIYVGQNSKLDIGGMLFSGILIASLGAVMDVAMSVSSSLHEIKRKTDLTYQQRKYSVQELILDVI